VNFNLRLLVVFAYVGLAVIALALFAIPVGLGWLCNHIEVTIK
jgi:hypothetical protein